LGPNLRRLGVFPRLVYLGIRASKLQAGRSERRSERGPCSDSPISAVWSKVIRELLCGTFPPAE
jgi:hypothetical protein